MKHFLSSCTSAIAAGAIAALIICTVAHRTHVVPARISARASSFPPNTIVATAVPAPNWLQGVIQKGVGWLNDGRASERKGTLGLLLREPVVILYGGGVSGMSLPIGTAVRLVHNDGRFLRVQHDQSVITIPRTAVVEGISRLE